MYPDEGDYNLTEGNFEKEDSMSLQDNESSIEIKHLTLEIASMELDLERENNWWSRFMEKKQRKLCEKKQQLAELLK